MPRPASGRVRKNHRLHPDVLARAQAALGTETATETIDRALRLAAGEAPTPAQDDFAARAATGHGILKLFGSISHEDADAMLRAIEEGCERIDDESPPVFPD